MVRNRSRLPRPCLTAPRGLWIRLILLLPLAFASVRASAQNPSLGQTLQSRRTVPTDLYFLSFQDFHEGRYSNALRDFNSVLRGGIRDTRSRWIDSICYFTMRGETYYEMGRLPEALNDYTSALELFVAFPDWMIRVNFPDAIQPNVTLRGPDAPWGQSQRGVKRGRFPRTMLIGQGRINNNAQIQQGGVVQPPKLFPINPREIVRCTVLAIRRRAELMGPAGPHDRLTKDVEAALNRRPGLLNHWSEAWIDLQLGVALAASGKIPQAKGHLERSVLAAGEFDHPLTGEALLSLGKIALDQADFQTAAKDFEEASYAAMRYPLHSRMDNVSLIEEALRYGLLTHLVSNQAGIYPPLEAAAKWAKINRYYQLQASMLIGAAESYARLGDRQTASALLSKAQAAIGRKDMRAGRLGARLDFVSAQVLYGEGLIKQGDKAITSALAYQRRGSHRVFHILLADRLYTQGAISPRVAMKVYQAALSDPVAADWAFEPLEALSLLLAPSRSEMAHWFEVALERREQDAAVEIADLARRHRFLHTLPLGGRLLSLRWVLEAPEAAISQTARLQRRDLLARFAGYQQASQEAHKLRHALKQEPLLPEDQDARGRQIPRLKQLAELSSRREAVLRQVAVLREPSELAFPPVLPAKQLRAALPKSTGILSFFSTSKKLYGFLITHDRVDVWTVGEPKRIEKRIVGLLRTMGQVDANRELSLAQLSSTDWKKPAGQLLETLFEGTKSDFPGDLKALIIVPDGALWYVPFEALQISAEGKSRPLISRLRIRWAPLTSLAVADLGPRRPVTRTAVVLGRLFPRDDQDVAAEAYEELRTVLPAATKLSGSLPAPPPIFASMVDQLVVWDDLGVKENSPYGWSPLPAAADAPGGTLADWLKLPWASTTEMILPGFHTIAENGMKHRRPIEAGDDLFLPICGLMASGARTVLITRWRTGGRTSLDLIREFVQELPHTSAADAWQRSVFLTMDTPVNPDAEPRVGRGRVAAPPMAKHPFFWAGYLLIDAGVSSPDGEPADQDGVAAQLAP